MCLCALRSKGITDAEIVRPREFNDVVNAAPDTHFVCLYIRDSRWKKTDEYSSFEERLEANTPLAENSRVNSVFYDVKEAVVWAQEMKNMWESLSEMTKVMMERDGLTTEGERVVLCGPSDGKSIMRRWTVTADNFVAELCCNQELMYLFVSGCLQIATVNVY